MGGTGSGSTPSRAGRPKKRAVEVIGTGVPVCPNDVPAEVATAFTHLVDVTQGVTFAQDSYAILEAARLMVRSDSLSKLIDATPSDVELHRLALATTRQLTTMLAKLGLTPRDRQLLLMPVPEVLPQSVHVRDRKARFFNTTTNH